jgi:hypothetical protein
MSTNRNLLKEAIADAKTVKETAIANAKAVLEESFAPQLKSMISLKLQEMADEDEDEALKEAGFGKGRAEGDVGFSDMTKALDEDEYGNEESMEEDLDLNELFEELNEEEDEESEKEDEESEEEGEPIDLEEFTDEDLKKMIEDVITDMMKSGELEVDAEEGEDEMMGDEEAMEDEEINLEELLKEIDAMDEDEMENEGMNYEEDLEEGKFGDFLKNVGSAIKSAFSSKIEGWDEYQKTPEFGKFAGKYIGEDGTIDSDKQADPMYNDDVKRLGLHYQNWLIKNYQLDPGVARKEANDFKESLGLLFKRGKTSSVAGEFTGGGVKEIQAELEEAYATIKTLRQDLNEINLLNAKLLYTNKIFKSKNLNENQKVKVLSSFDKATTVGEVKLVFETLNEGLKVKATKLNENLGSASKVLNAPKKQPIVESNDMVARFQKLAGII